MFEVVAAAAAVTVVVAVKKVATGIAVESGIERLGCWVRMGRAETRLCVDLGRDLPGVWNTSLPVLTWAEMLWILCCPRDTHAKLLANSWRTLYNPV